MVAGYLTPGHQLSPVLRALARARSGKLNREHHQQLSAELERIAQQIRQARERWEMELGKLVAVEEPPEG